jgi:hypothetical protein
MDIELPGSARFGAHATSASLLVAMGQLSAYTQVWISPEEIVPRYSGVRSPEAGGLYGMLGYHKNKTGTQYTYFKLRHVES